MDFGGYHVVGYHYDDQRSKLNLPGTKVFKNRHTRKKRKRPGQLCKENFAKLLDKYTWHMYNESMTIKLGKRSEVSYE